MNAQARREAVELATRHIASAHSGLNDASRFIRAYDAALTAADQALWDIYGALGFDQDGDKTPPAMTPPLSGIVLRAAQEFRAESEAELDAVEARYDRLRDAVQPDAFCRNPKYRDATPGHDEPITVLETPCGRCQGCYLAVLLEPTEPTPQGYDALLKDEAVYLRVEKGALGVVRSWLERVENADTVTLTTAPEPMGERASTEEEK